MAEANDTGDDAVAMTSAMLRALTHPIRRSILRVLPRLEYVRAADLAEELGEPANKISFHLRVLADAGLIVEAPEQARDRRDRVWTNVKHSLSIGSPEHPVEDEVAGRTVMHALAEDHTDLLRRVMTWGPEWISGRTAEVHGTFIRATMRLTVDEFEDMMKAVSTAMKKAEEAHAPDAEDTRVWSIDILAADDTL